MQNKKNQLKFLQKTNNSYMINVENSNITKRKMQQREIYACVPHIYSLACATAVAAAMENDGLKERNEQLNRKGVELRH